MERKDAEIKEAKVTDVVILAGGLGTRIRHLLPPGMPKCLANINGRPFLSILLEYVRAQGFERIILATGYGSAHINDLYGKECIISYSEPRGTWDAIKQAAEHVKSDPFLVLNGDTFCELDYRWMLERHSDWRWWVTVVVDVGGTPVGVFVAPKLDMTAAKLPVTGSIEDAIDWCRQFGMVAQLMTDKPFYDIGTPKGLERFRNEHKKSSIDAIPPAR